MSNAARSHAPDHDEVVLVVDDDAGMRETLVDILGVHGIRAAGAGTAAAAIAQNRTLGAAVAVVDQRLPDTTGVELSASLKADDADLQIVLLTGYPTVESAIAAVSQADEFLTKPVAPDQLVRVVQAALARVRLRRENAELLARLHDTNVRLESSVADRSQDLRGLASLAEAISQAQGVEQVLAAVVRTAADAAGAATVGVYLEDGSGTLLSLRNAWPSPGQLPVSLPRVQSAQGERGVGPNGLRSDLVVGGQRLGALVLVDPARTNPSFVNTLAIEAAVAIQNAQRFDRERETVERVSELSRMKSTFLASVSHELRTPLTALVGFAQTLGAYDQSLTGDDRRHMLDRMVAQGERLGRLINNLLDSTGLETGTLRVTVGGVPVRPVIDRVVDSLPDEGVTIHVAVPDEIPLVLGDEGRLEQVLGNLLENAVKYASDGPVRIAVEATADAVRFTVADEGPGMDPTFLPRAFEPFSQAGTGDNKFERGVGLGLYVVHGLVDAMGGTISVTSAPGEGTTFVVSLPRA